MASIERMDGEKKQFTSRGRHDPLGVRVVPALAHASVFPEYQGSPASSPSSKSLTMQLEEVMSLLTIDISSAEKPSSPNQENLSQKQLDASENVDEEALKVTNIFGFEKVVGGASEWPIYAMK